MLDTYHRCFKRWSESLTIDRRLSTFPSIDEFNHHRLRKTIFIFFFFFIHVIEHVEEIAAFFSRIKIRLCFYKLLWLLFMIKLTVKKKDLNARRINFVIVRLLSFVILIVCSFESMKMIKNCQKKNETETINSNVFFLFWYLDSFQDVSFLECSISYVSLCFILFTILIVLLTVCFSLLLCLSLAPFFFFFFSCASIFRVSYRSIGQMPIDHSNWVLFSHR